jgi:hypothetical protein
MWLQAPSHYRICCPRRPSERSERGKNFENGFLDPLIFWKSILYFWISEKKDGDLDNFRRASRFYFLYFENWSSKITPDPPSKITIGNIWPIWLLDFISSVNGLFSSWSILGSAEN